MGLFDAFLPQIPQIDTIIDGPMVNPWTDGTAQSAAWEAKSETEQKWLGGADPTDPFIATRMKDSLASITKSVTSPLELPSQISSQITNKIDEVAQSAGGLVNTLAQRVGIGSKSPKSIASMISEDSGVNGYAVRLIAARNFPQEHVIFRATPSFSESRAVEYAQVAPVHMPGSIQVYRRTGSRTFSVGAKFISRNRAQASENMKYLQLLRGWSMPYFGERDYISNASVIQELPGGASTSSDDNTSMLGAPPDVLYLYAYSSTVGDAGDRAGGQVNIKKVPVVITNINIVYPDDVDYIPVEDTNEPFPVKMDVSLELLETHSPVGYEKFSLSMFKKGELVQF